jgi:hypothetical protein
MTAERVMDMFETTAEIEALCVRLATFRITPIERSRLQNMHEASAELVRTGNIDAYDDFNREFHEARLAAFRRTHGPRRAASPLPSRSSAPGYGRCWHFFGTGNALGRPLVFWSRKTLPRQGRSWPGIGQQTAPGAFGQVEVPFRLGMLGEPGQGCDRVEPQPVEPLDHLPRPLVARPRRPPCPGSSPTSRHGHHAAEPCSRCWHATSPRTLRC